MVEVTAVQMLGTFIRYRRLSGALVVCWPVRPVQNGLTIVYLLTTCVQLG